MSPSTHSHGRSSPPRRINVYGVRPEPGELSLSNPWLFIGTAEDPRMAADLCGHYIELLGETDGSVPPGCQTFEVYCIGSQRTDIGAAAPHPPVHCLTAVSHLEDCHCLPDIERMHPVRH